MYTTHTPSSRAEIEDTIDISSMDSSYAVTMSLMQMIADAYESAERRSKNLARGNGKEGEGGGCSNLKPTSVRPEPGQEKVVQWLVSRRFLPPNYLPDRDLEKYYPPPSSTETAANNIINVSSGSIWKELMGKQVFGIYKLTPINLVAWHLQPTQ
ncbi:hypothetical protein D9613_004058 [Agrocybe pediades]|uniref:Uncharacterized protein n=1 Tax=Agrocybe pediades TaxID=84607 RepID=A0A8H4QJE6_9AGAR|nr:hypothetical protein D9613_004058 [Agrocybe pediades]